MTLTSLGDLLEHETMGQRARFERFAADMLYTIAAGAKVDTNRVTRFGVQLEEVYRNPFRKKAPELKTAAEIIQHVCDRIDELLAGATEEDNNGSDETRGENHAG